LGFEFAIAKMAIVKPIGFDSSSHMRDESAKILGSID
jgi:hypothetical protein